MNRAPLREHEIIERPKAVMHNKEPVPLTIFFSESTSNDFLNFLVQSREKLNQKNFFSAVSFSSKAFAFTFVLKMQLRPDMAIH